MGRGYQYGTKGLLRYGSPPAPTPKVIVDAQGPELLKLSVSASTKGVFLNIFQIQTENVIDENALREYHYEPLCAPDAVLVLVLTPAGDISAPLRCAMVQYSHSEPPLRTEAATHYTAVSYI